MAKARSTAVAIAFAQSTAVAETYDYGEFAGHGFENRSASDLSIPFLNILQPLSPEVTEGTVDGAKAGMIFNSVTNELYDGDKGVNVLWVFDDKKFVEWIPRTAGGGLVGMHEAGSPEVRDAIAANKGSTVGAKIGSNDLVETRYVYCLTLNEAGTEVNGFAVVAAKSTNLKPIKDWYTAMMMVRPAGAPTYAFKTRIRTVKEKNDKGSWFRVDAKPLGADWKSCRVNPASERNMLDEAKAFADMVKSGKAKADFTQEQRSGGGAGGDGEPVPF